MLKKRFEDLALAGGIPAFAEKLHVGRPNIGDRARLLARINDLLDRRWLTNDGPYVQEFEERLSAFVGVKHCVAVCNATIALEITTRALGLEGEVIVPSMTFIATAHALQWQQIAPVFCDIEATTHTLDPGRVEAMITPRTTGIIGVHLWGRPCQVEKLAEIAERRRLKLLFDAAHAFGASHNGRMIGGFGEAEVFSFHGAKFLNAFEGGAVATNNDELARRIRLMRNFGFAGYDNVIYIGTNGKMSEPSAAMGLTSLESVDEFVAVNRRNYHEYQEAVGALEGVRLLPYDEGEKCNYQYIVAEVDEDVTRVSRDDLIGVLWGENVLARRYFSPGCHRMEPYRSYYPHASLLLPVTERVTKGVIVLPTGPAVEPETVREICQIIRCAIEHAPQVSRALRVTRGRKDPGATA